MLCCADTRKALHVDGVHELKDVLAQPPAPVHTSRGAAPAVGPDAGSDTAAAVVHDLTGSASAGSNGATTMEFAPQGQPGGGSARVQPRGCVDGGGSDSAQLPQHAVEATVAEVLSDAVEACAREVGGEACEGDAVHAAHSPHCAAAYVKRPSIYGAGQPGETAAASVAGTPCTTVEVGNGESMQPAGRQREGEGQAGVQRGVSRTSRHCTAQWEAGGSGLALDAVQLPVGLSASHAGMGLADEGAERDAGPQVDGSCLEGPARVPQESVAGACGVRAASEQHGACAAGGLIQGEGGLLRQPPPRPPAVPADGSRGHAARALQDRPVGAGARAGSPHSAQHAGAECDAWEAGGEGAGGSVQRVRPASQGAAAVGGHGGAAEAAGQAGLAEAEVEAADVYFMVNMHTDSVTLLEGSEGEAAVGVKVPLHVLRPQPGAELLDQAERLAAVLEVCPCGPAPASPALRTRVFLGFAQPSALLALSCRALGLVSSSIRTVNSHTLRAVSRIRVDVACRPVLCS